MLLLPPSEGKALGGARRRRPDHFGAHLHAPRAEVHAALTRAMATRSSTELARLLRVRGPLLSRALEASEALLSGTEYTLPAWERYQGVVWDHLMPATLAESDRARLLIPSALYGLNRGTDRIADYRLTMHVGLPGLGNLARFWRPHLSELLSSMRARPTLINLLPAEHQAAIDFAKLDSVVSIDFVRDDGGGAAGHAAKAAKGRFARHLLDHGLEAAGSFDDPEWRIAPSARGFTLTMQSPSHRRGKK